MANLSQANRLLSVTTPLAADVLLLDSLVASEGVSRPFRFDLKLVAEIAAGSHSKVLPEKLIGNGMTVSVMLADGTARYFHGIVKRFTEGGSDSRLAHYRAELVPWLSLLGLTSDCRVFQEKTVPEIIEEVFTDLEFRDYKLALDRTYTKWDYCVQYRESDFNFVSRLMEQEGIFYYFEHQQDLHTLVLADAVSKYEDCPKQAVAIMGPLAGAAEKGDTVNSWESNHELLSGKWALRDYHFEMPRTDLQVEEPALKPAAVASNLEIFDYPGEYAQKFNQPAARLGDVRPEGEVAVKLRMQEEETHQTVLGGTSNCRAFTAGYKFELNSKSFLLTGIEHSAVQRPGYLSDHNLGGAAYNNSFACIPADVPFRPGRKTPKPTIQGPQTARVVDETNSASGTPSEEIWPDKFGRVRVRFPWDREGKHSCWVRVAQHWAGKGWGQQWIPRVGDEVIVTFLEGDPDCPIVVGSVYNGENAPPFALPDNKTQSGVKTRSSPKGTADNYNMIRFEDKKGSEEVYIHAEKNKTVQVENDRTETVGHNENITIGNDRTESVGKNESIDIGENRTENVGKDESITIGQNRSESVGKDETISITKNQTLEIGENRTETVGKNEQVGIGENRAHTVGKNDSLNVGKTLLIDVGDEITIKTGDASITMKKNGDIQIKGKEIKLVGSGKIGIKADSEVNIKGSKVTNN
jgi:type VI secretion system secreted protein VgrG